MRYKATIEGFEGQNVEVDMNFWTAPKLYVNGSLAPKGPARGQSLIKRNDGKEIVVTLKPQLIGLDVPRLDVGGKSIELVQPLAWHEWLFAGSPVMLFLMGGAVGVGLAFIGVFINLRIFRSEFAPALKYLFSAGVTIFFIVAYAIFSIVLIYLVNR